MHSTVHSYSGSHPAIGAEVFRVREQLNPISPVEVERIWRQRRERFRYFPDGLFADPAWDMLLHLYATELFGARTSIKGVIQSSHVPDTTGLRWLNILVDRGLCKKSPDLMDARRQYVTLTDVGRSAMDNYFSSRRGADGADIRFAA